MKKRYICNGVIVVLAVLILVSMVFCYVTINPEQFSGTEKEFLEYVISGVDADGQLSFSALTMIQGMFMSGSAADLVENVFLQSLIFQFKIILLLPYVMAVLILIFGLLKPRWSYFVTAGLSCVSPAVLLVYGGLYLPDRMTAVLDDLLSGPVVRLTYYLLLGDTGAEYFRSIIQKSLGAGFWLIPLCSVLCLVLSLAAYFITGEKKTEAHGRKKKTEKAEKIPDAGAPDISQEAAGEPLKEPCIFCGCGELKGARIPLNDGDEIKIGKNYSSCNLIILADGISGLHCVIRFSEKEQRYTLSAYAPTWVESIGILDGGQTVYVRRGSRIELGNGDNGLVLE